MPLQDRHLVLRRKRIRRLPTMRRVQRPIRGSRRATTVRRRRPPRTRREHGRRRRRAVRAVMMRVLEPVRRIPNLGAPLCAVPLCTREAMRVRQGRRRMRRGRSVRVRKRGRRQGGRAHRCQLRRLLGLDLRLCDGE
jgi:hypothetical protein